ncbi:MAG: C39 family peptidase [Phycisphaerae bacterium]|nr:C39 family peptidase [Phycisphaerae bacterium]
MRKKLQIVLLTAMAVGLPWGAYVFSQPPKPDPSSKKITASPKSTAPTKSKESKKPVYRAVLVEAVPHIRQKPDFCGEACAAMYLRKLGYRVSQDEVFNASKLDPAFGRGCHAAELKAALDRLGFDIGDNKKIWQRFSAMKRTSKMDTHFKALHADLVGGIPSIICTYYSDKPSTTQHFRLILGYDPKTDEVIYHEPAENKGAYKRMKRDTFLRIWPLKTSKSYVTVIRFRLKPGKIKLPKSSNPAGPKQNKFTAADYAQHIVQLKQNPPVKNLTYVVMPPFVVVGNESPATVRKRAAGTVRWATRMYKKDYFRHDPAVIYTIWLLKDKKTYEAATKKLCRYAPDTPFGFFSPTRRVLVMNIATGGGTLVHEMFHAFVPANFPDLPSWLNEGIASLYEQSSQRDGKIVGFTNWRLKGLKAAIRAKKTISLKKLAHTTTAEFYGPGSDVHYAMARYLCYYLQENGKLRKYYHAFYKNRKADPTGYKTLVEILGKPDMEKFQKNWQAWCMKLKFP